MRLFILYIICATTLFASCNWVNDDLTDCPTGTWLKVAYTYNLSFADAAPKQVGDIIIFAFDKNGKYADRVEVDSATLHQNNCMVKVPFPEGTYNFIVWGGTSDKTYKFPSLTRGVSEMGSFTLALKCCGNGNQQKDRLNALFYSSLGNVTISNEYQVFSAFLIKNTNYFSCLLQNEAKVLLNQEDFAFMLEAANGIMDCSNTPVDKETVYYHPYQQEDTSMAKQISVVHARLNTLRLMKEDHTILSIKHIPSGHDILRIPITQYLLITKIYNMDDQEYLDRQDLYTLFFFIKDSDTGIPEICPEMSVNNWMIRLNISELESY